MAVHVRYNSWYISLPSSAKQQRENDQVLRCPRNMDDAGFSYFHLEIERRRCVFSCGTFLEPLAYRTELDHYKFHLCLSSLLTVSHPPAFSVEH